MGSQFLSRSQDITNMFAKCAGVVLCLGLMVAAQRRGQNKRVMFEKMQKEEGQSYESTVPGTPGQDYPVFRVAPSTTFSCTGLVNGYYADQEADCQTYHVCPSNGDPAPISTLLCPNGTLYNQQYFVCDWWFNVDCSIAAEFYSLNEEVAAAAAEANSLRLN